MSRIGKKPVTVPKGVTITVGSDNVLTVKGPKGELKQVRNVPGPDGDGMNKPRCERVREEVP